MRRILPSQNTSKYVVFSEYYKNTSQYLRENTLDFERKPPCSLIKEAVALLAHAADINVRTDEYPEPTPLTIATLEPTVAA